MANKNAPLKVPCHCPDCTGNYIDQVAWLRHNGLTTIGSFGATQDEMWYMGHWWDKRKGSNNIEEM
jgi:hypothetical protein